MADSVITTVHVKTEEALNDAITYFNENISPDDSPYTIDIDNDITLHEAIHIDNDSVTTIDGKNVQTQLIIQGTPTDGSTTPAIQGRNYPPPCGEAFSLIP